MNETLDKLKPTTSVEWTPRTGGKVIQSVDRAIDLLEILAKQENERTLNEISGLTGINQSTLHHLLSTLLRRGYVEQNSRTRMYQLGNKALELSRARARQLDVVRLAAPVLRQLRDSTGETVHLSRMQAHDLTILTTLDSPHAVRVDTEGVGVSGAAHATALGKAILAWLPEREIASIVAEKGMRAFTDRTITSLGSLLQELALVRRHGYAMEQDEFQPDVVCTGAAIRDHTGAVIASVSCSAPKARATEAHVKLMIEQIKEGARLLSERLGSPNKGK